MDRKPIIKNILDLAAKQIKRAYKIDYSPQLFGELEKSNIIEKLNISVKKNDVFKKRQFNSIYELNVYRNFLYYLVRIVKPEKIIETGVFHGLTSMWILKALEDNNYGKLVSIDLPRRDWNKFFPNKKMGAGHQSEEELPENQDPGWLIPEDLRSRWELLIGPSESLLENEVKKSRVDFFIHDSDHSFKTMKFEIETILNYNRKSFIAVDNYDHSKFIYQLLAKDDFTYAFINELDEFNDIFPRFAILKKGFIETSEDRWQAQLKERKKS
jgi:hypothetical protein